MFSLVIAIISILLVAALAIATLYYGGQQLQLGSSRAHAAKIINQGQQVLGAAELFYSENGRWPNDTGELVNKGYLRSVPVARAQVLSAAVADEPQSWVMPTAGVPVFTLAVDQAEVCREFNALSLTTDGVPSKVVTSARSLCYSAQPDRYTAVVARTAENLTQAFDAAQLATALPTTADSPDWALSPKVQVAQVPQDSASAPADPASSPSPGSYKTTVTLVRKNAQTWTIAMADGTPGGVSRFWSDKGDLRWDDFGYYVNSEALNCQVTNGFHDSALAAGPRDLNTNWAYSQAPSDCIQNGIATVNEVVFSFMYPDYGNPAARIQVNVPVPPSGNSASAAWCVTWSADNFTPEGATLGACAP